jgi:hypothetical protein
MLNDMVQQRSTTVAIIPHKQSRIEMTTIVFVDFTIELWLILFTNKLSPIFIYFIMYKFLSITYIVVVS